jgi:hypothetical protein
MHGVITARGCIALHAGASAGRPLYVAAARGAAAAAAAAAAASHAPPPPFGKEGLLRLLLRCAHKGLSGGAGGPCRRSGRGGAVRRGGSGWHIVGRRLEAAGGGHCDAEPAPCGGTGRSRASVIAQLAAG